MIFRKRPAQTGGMEGVAVRVRRGNVPEPPRPSDSRRMPRRILLGVLLATAFYIVSHLVIVRTVWPVHGTSPGAGAVLVRDAVSMVAWLLLLPVLRFLGYRGSWAIVALPIIIFLLTRPALFQLFTDPAYQAGRGARAEANLMKAERSRLTTVIRAYDEERQQIVFGEAVPELPNPMAVVAEATAGERANLGRLGSAMSVVLAPLALLIGFALARGGNRLRWWREHRIWPFGITLGIFFILTMFFTELGKVAGTTPWELFLPVFVFAWAATLADDAYNLARPDQVVAPRRVLWLVLYGAMPVVPFLIIRELGLSIVLAGSMAAMLLVGTRRGWWAGLMMVVWTVLVIAAFSLDDRSATRLALAIEPYRDLSAMTEPEAESWAARLHQIKLFDANILAGGIFGEGAGQGHAETAPNAADDGYITTIAAQWGLAGALALALLYTAFLIQMLAAAMRERGAFERSLVTGLAMLIGIPFWLATLGGIRIIPLTGVAAAFAAHGGAKLLASAFAVGLVAAISHRRGEADRLAGIDAPAESLTDRGIRIR
jgi:cell division protein FtsW (lipid II flippase)